jgi:hypothetical protein
MTQFDNTVNVLLGFGGSGGKILKSLMEHMAQDPAGAKLASERCHIVLVDTDEGDLQRVQTSIKEGFERYGLDSPPPIESFSLAEGVDQFQDLVTARMFPAGDSEQDRAQRLDKLKKFWWFRGNTPFSAPNMPENVDKGAAQCPLVSHMLAWDKLAAFERVLAKIGDHALNKRHLERFSVDLFIASGLAGGTGRGSWQLLSLKAREYFGQPKNGERACRPIGFFLDSSCFDDIMRNRPEQAIKMQVNSLTGLSELSMWLRSAVPLHGRIANGDDEACHEARFMLPNLAEPFDVASAAIDTDRYMPQELRTKHGRSPIHRAFIFTSRSSGMRLETSDDAYRAVAASMYGRLCQKSVRSADANEPERAGATSTSILYVPIAGIRLCVLHEANRLLLDVLRHGEKFVEHWNPDATEGLPRYTSPDFIQHQSSRLKALGKFLLVESEEAWTSLVHSDSTAITEDPKAKIISALCNRRDQALMAGKRNRQQLTALMNGSIRSLNDNEVSEAVFRALADSCPRTDEPDTPEALKPEAVKLRAKSRLNQHLIIEPVREALKEHGVRPAYELACQLGREAGRIKQALDKVIQAKEGVGSSEAADAARGFSEADLRKYFNIFGSLSAAQRGKLKRAFRVRLGAAAMVRALKGLGECASGAEKVAKDLEMVLMQADLALEREIRQQGAARDRQREGCFTVLSSVGESRIREEDSLLRQLEQSQDPSISKLIKQVKPLYDEAKFRRHVGRVAEDSKALASARFDLSDEVLRAVDDATRGGGSSRDLGEKLRERLNTIIKRQQVPMEGLEETYGLRPVLGELMEEWFRIYGERRGEMSFTQRFSRAVEYLSGINLKQLYDEAVSGPSGGRDSDLRAPDSLEVMSRASLKLAEGCDPLVQHSTAGADRRDRVTIVLACRPGGKEDRDLEGRINSIWDKTGHFVHIQQVHGRNPFAVVAVSDLPKSGFADEGWEGWFDVPADPDVRAALDKCELPDGDSVWDLKHGSIGLGYLCPEFVRNAHFAKRRWAPWSRQTDAMHQRWLALGYALIGNSFRGTRPDMPWARQYDEFRATFAECFSQPGRGPDEHDHSKVWTLPLLRDERGGGGPQFTRVLFNNSGQLRQNGLDLPANPKIPTSNRRFMRWFRSEDANDVVRSILHEHSIFAELIQARRMTDEAMHNHTSAAHSKSLLTFLENFVETWLKEIDDGTLAPEDKQEQGQFLREFLGFIKRQGEARLDYLKPQVG